MITLLFLFLFTNTFYVSALDGFQAARIAYERGEYKTAFKKFLQLANQGDAQAQYFIGVMYVKGRGITQNITESMKWFRKAAEQGDAKAQYELGERHECGCGISLNTSEAVKWYRMAAKQGHAKAQYILGVMYEIGKGVEKNYVNAQMWNILASAQGHSDAKRNLSSLDQKMTPHQRAEAKRLANELMLKR
jgi:TPR repeat protein